MGIIRLFLGRLSPASQNIMTKNLVRLSWRSGRLTPTTDGRKPFVRLAASCGTVAGSLRPFAKRKMPAKKNLLCEKSIPVFMFLTAVGCGRTLGVFQIAMLKENII